MSEVTPPSEEAYAGASPSQPKRRPPLLHRAVLVSQELPAYQGRFAWRDVLAGVTVAALALPSAMAYAELAGLSPVNGLELAGALAVLVGACFLVARVLRLGWLADYFSRPVLIGYLHGVAARAKTPLLASLSDFGLSGLPVHPTVRAAVAAAV